MLYTQVCCANVLHILDTILHLCGMVAHPHDVSSLVVPHHVLLPPPGDHGGFTSSSPSWGAMSSFLKHCTDRWLWCRHSVSHDLCLLHVTSTVRPYVNSWASVISVSFIPLSRIFDNKNFWIFRDLYHGSYFQSYNSLTLLIGVISHGTGQKFLQLSVEFDSTHKFHILHSAPVWNKRRVLSLFAQYCHQVERLLLRSVPIRPHLHRVIIIIFFRPSSRTDKIVQAVKVLKQLICNKLYLTTQYFTKRGIGGIKWKLAKNTNFITA